MKEAKNHNILANVAEVSIQVYHHLLQCLAQKVQQRNTNQHCKNQIVKAASPPLLFLF
jgi:hypothetical protein